MKKIVQYQAKDDIIFSDKDECIEYEKQLDFCTDLVDQLEDIERDTDFGNGDGYIQQKSETVIRLRKEMVAYAKTFDLVSDRDIHDAFIGGLRHLYYRLSCIDGNWREWGQKYYAINPSEGIGTCVNPKGES